jgi:hypothetical protein
MKPLCTQHELFLDSQVRRSRELLLEVRSIVKVILQICPALYLF